MTRSLLLAALALVLSTSSMAQTPAMQRGTLSSISRSTQLGVQTGTVSTRATSGQPGTASQTLMPGEDAVLMGLLVGEKNGRVCYVQGEFWRKATPQNSRRIVRQRFDQCNPQIGRSPQVGQVKFFRLGQGGEIYSGDEFRVAQGIQTCTDGNGPAISDNSLLLYEGEVGSNGTITTMENLIAAVQGARSTACTQNLQTASRCSDGQVVVGVDVRYRPGVSGGHATVVGLAPKCAPITVTSGTALSPSN